MKLRKEYFFIALSIVCALFLTACHPLIIYTQDQNPKLENIDFIITTNIKTDTTKHGDMPVLEFEVLATNNNTVEATLEYGLPCISMTVNGYETSERIGTPIWNGNRSRGNFCQLPGFSRTLQPAETFDLFVKQYRLDEIPLYDNHYYFTADLGVNIRGHTSPTDTTGFINAGNAYLETSSYVQPVPSYNGRTDAAYKAKIVEEEDKLSLNLEVINISDKSISVEPTSRQQNPEKCSLWLREFGNEASLNRWSWDWKFEEENWPYQCLVKDFEKIVILEGESHIFSYPMAKPDWEKLESSAAYFLVLTDLRIAGTGFLPYIEVSAGKLEKK